jgi:hypothetical protein
VDEEVKLALEEVNLHLTRALEEVPLEAFAGGAPEERLRLQELIAQAGGIVASELSHNRPPGPLEEMRRRIERYVPCVQFTEEAEDFRLDCSFPPIYEDREER